jgi:hypothetical protein
MQLLARALVVHSSEVQPDASPKGFTGLTPKQASSSATDPCTRAGVERLFEVPMRVNSRDTWLSMTQHGLADGDVLGHVVRPSAQAMTEAVPAKTLAFVHQSQIDCGMFDELAVHGLPP